MKQVERRCSRQPYAHTPRLPAYALCTVASTLPPRCSPGRICAASELHGRDTDDERRRTGGALLHAAKDRSAGRFLPGGLGTVRPGCAQEWPERLLTGNGPFLEISLASARVMEHCVFHWMGVADEPVSDKQSFSLDAWLGYFVLNLKSKHTVVDVAAGSDCKWILRRVFAPSSQLVQQLLGSSWRPIWLSYHADSNWLRSPRIQSSVVQAEILSSLWGGRSKQLFGSGWGKK